VDHSPIFGLGYVHIRSTRQDEWRTFAESVLGMMVNVSEDGAVLVRMDDWVARLIIEDAPRPPHAGASRVQTDEVAFGWECRDETAWGVLRSALDDAGVAVDDGGGSTLWCREWFGCCDPSGFRLEFFYGGKKDPASQFVSPLGNRFMTGSQGLGHVLLFSDRCTEAVSFYENVLLFQMRESKTAPDGTIRVGFLSPNEREHSVALVASPDQSRIGHLLIEVTELDAVGRAMDRCLDGIAPMTVSLGRHTNDEMISFYLRTPSGFDIEYGFGGKTVDADRWSRGEVGGSGLTSFWGHRRVNPDGTLGVQLGRQPAPAR